MYDVPAMHATYSPLDEMHATLDDVYATLDDVYATVHPLDDMDAFPDDRIVDAMDKRTTIAMDNRKGAVDKVSKKEGDEEEKKRNCTNHRRPLLGRAVLCLIISRVVF